MSPNATPALPSSPEEVSLEWLQTILAEPTLSGFEITRKRLNETSCKLYVTLSYPDEAAAVAAKKPKNILLKGAFNPAVLAMPVYRSVLIPIYHCEVNFFNKVAKNLPADGSSGLHMPIVYWADNSPDNGILAMEDMDVAGYVFGDPAQTYSLAAVRSGIQQLAALHGHTWGWSKPEGASKTPDNEWLAVTTYEDAFYNMMKMWDDLIDGPNRPAVPPIISESRERMERALTSYFAKRNPRFRCLIHGDPHSGNTFYRAADPRGSEKLYFLDWQVTHIGTPFHDLSYFIQGSLNIEDRRAHEWELVDYYLEELAKRGGPKLSRDDPEVAIEYRRSSISGFAWIMTPYTMQSQERVEAMSPRFSAAMVDHKTVQLLTGEGGDASA